MTLRRHWLIVVLMLAGLVLRALSLAAYQPALLYIDSLKYLFGAWPGNDPLGYNVILKVLLAGGNLNTVTVIQHLTGLAMAGVLYLLLLRRGTPRWLAALAAAPVLLDAYQVQIEQTIMPDVWFEALIVAGLALLLWRPEPGPWLIAAGGLALGASAPIAQVGQILIVPAVIYLLIVEPGWRRKLLRAAVLCAAFVRPHRRVLAPRVRRRPPVLACAGRGQHHLRPAGRERRLRDAEAPQLRAGGLPAAGPRDPARPGRAGARRPSPDHTYVAPPGRTHGEVIGNFEHRVITQQPLRVVGGVLGDATRLFELHRVTSTGDTPISRWQFQTSYPTTAAASTSALITPSCWACISRPAAARSRSGRCRPAWAGGPRWTGRSPRSCAATSCTAATRQDRCSHWPPWPGWQARSSPWPAGLAQALGRGFLAPRQRELALACLLIFGSAVAVLLASDLFEFSWRYQLPALVMLPPAGALGLAVLGSLLRRRAAPANSSIRNGTVPGNSPAPAAGERPDPGPAGQAEPHRAS